MWNLEITFISRNQSFKKNIDPWINEEEKYSPVN
jgi:hypothetical protein